MVILIMTYHNNGKTEHTHIYINKYINLYYMPVCACACLSLCVCVGV